MDDPLRENVWCQALVLVFCFRCGTSLINLVLAVLVVGVYEVCEGCVLLAGVMVIVIHKGLDLYVG